MNAESSFNVLKETTRLPSPSGVALAIIKLVQREDATVQQVAQLIKSDPALSGRILGFANSAAFGARRAIASVEDAAFMIGTDAVRNFALSLSLLDDNRQGDCAAFDYPFFWSRSLARAVALAALTTRERSVPPEEAFTLGLLSDIGRLALASVWPDAYGECLKQARNKHLLKLEQERFAITHRTLTEMLLADWGLPQPFLEATKLSFAHEVTEASRVGRLARQLIFCRQLAKYCLADSDSRAALMPTLEKEVCHHAMNADTLQQVLDEIVERWHLWGKEIDIKTDIRYSESRSNAPTISQAANLDLLLVDDDPIITRQLSKKLSEAGYQVAVCRDGESALKYVIQHRPPLLITDWRMQPMDGLSLCKALRNTAFGQSIYIIMLTAAESEDELVDAFDAGIDDYVTKPVSVRVLLSRLRAGQRIVLLQQEVEKERRDVQRYTAELLTANRRLELMAHTDILTNLPNRRYALNRLAQEFEAGRRYNRPLSLLMLDLDHFKSINDTFGHDAGDQVLAHIAGLIKHAVRSNDIACRLGGEEFLVIATNTDGETALLLAERIRATIEKKQPATLKLTRPITISIGVAGSSPVLNSHKELMRLADKALYAVKQGARNGINLALAHEHSP
ncbi:GGDEF domain-containing response regulator [Methylomonas rapida]|uniref:diguanylate cyclase n=1 Tax=Methylomonas rapida TaxID=2963939 RepID=A0ABY7GE72_9GAMM|nr:diguanylate cyclase [Methylomonas rapida]WAR43099.1 diguanylate cyclase [Methylomonas rapida]